MSSDIPYVDRIYNVYLWDYISQNLFVWLIIPTTFFLFSLFFEKPRNWYIKVFKSAFNAVRELIPYRYYNKNKYKVIDIDKHEAYQLKIIQDYRTKKYSYELYNPFSWKLLQSEWFNRIDTNSIKYSIRINKWYEDCTPFWFDDKYFEWNNLITTWTIKLTNKIIG